MSDSEEDAQVLLDEQVLESIFSFLRHCSKGSHVDLPSTEHG